MKISTKVLGAVAAVSLSAGGFAALAPSGHAVVTNVASCSNNLRALGTAKSTSVDNLNVPEGITDSDNQDVSIGTKGVDPNLKGGTTLGTCTYVPGLSTPDSDKPINKGYNGAKNIAKWGSKLFSVESDCNTADTGDTTEWPISGQLSITYTDLTPVGQKQQKSTMNITVDGFTDPDNDPNTPSDVVSFHGLVVKGVAAGADVAGETMFDPIVKDTSQTTNTPYFGYQFDVGNALGCTTATPDDANIKAFVNGANSGNSMLLNLPVAGITTTVGS